MHKNALLCIFKKYEKMRDTVFDRKTLFRHVCKKCHFGAFLCTFCALFDLFFHFFLKNCHFLRKKSDFLIGVSNKSTKKTLKIEIEIPH